MYKEPIRAFLARSVPGEFGDDEDLLASGLVNEQFPTQLARFLESQFDIQIEDHEYDIGNFRSVNAINGSVERKVQTG